jgi:hypothetical protein
MLKLAQCSVYYCRIVRAPALTSDASRYWRWSGLKILMIPQIFTQARGPLAASAHEVGTSQVRVLIGCVFVEIVTESETCHICSAVLLTI